MSGSARDHGLRRRKRTTPACSSRAAPRKQTGRWLSRCSTEPSRRTSTSGYTHILRRPLRSALRRVPPEVEQGGKNRAVAGALVETLSRVPLFEELDAAELQSIAGSMHEATVPAGATVTVEGGPGNGFFVIESGEADVTIEGQPR